VVLAVAFSALTLLVRHQEEHLAFKKLSDGVLAGLFGAKCELFAYGPADATATTSFLALLKSRMVLPFWCRLTQVILKNLKQLQYCGFSSCCLLCSEVLQ